MAAKRNTRPRPVHRKTKRTEPGGFLHVGFYCVAFLDILGQRQKLLSAPAVPAKNEETITLLKETAGNVIKLRRRLDLCFKTFAQPSPYLDGVPDDVRTRILKAKQSVRYHGIGDAVLMEVLFAGQEPYVSLTGIYGCLAASCILQIVGLSSGSPIRGGIDVGWGINISENGGHEVYGPVLGTAYNLENKVAVYPRVVLSDGVISYLNQTLQSAQTTPEERFARKLADDCTRLITRDSDGRPMLDFLGKKMATLSTTEERHREIIDIRKYISEQTQLAISKNDLERLERYERLNAYVEANGMRWE